MRMIVHWTQGHVGRHQQDGAATGIEYGDEADEEADEDADGGQNRSAERKRRVTPARLRRGWALAGVFRSVPIELRPNLVAVLLGLPRRRGRLPGWVGRAVGTLLLLTPVTRWFSFGQHAANHLAVGIAGVCDEVERQQQFQGVQRSGESSSRIILSSKVGLSRLENIMPS